MKALGFKIDVVGVNAQGEFDLDQLRALVSEKTALVSVMYANNETGHIFPIRQIVDAAHAVGALVHCDAVQALGKMPIKLPELGVDLASFSGHKFYALKGCGVLFARRGLRLHSLIDGGGQERGRRAGTENVLAIASLGYMCAKGDEILPQAERMMRLRDKLETRVQHEIEGVHITGQSGLRLPNTSSMFIDDIDGETLLMNLDVRGFAVSTGAACSSGSPEPSPILLAMGLSRQEAQSSLRLSIGWETTEEDLDAFVVSLKEVVARLRKFKHGERYVYGL
jgi:cysteine desulfurase